MKIGIVVGSIREGRLGRSVGEWVLQQATQRDDAAYELVDLKDFDVPLLRARTLPGMADKQYDSPQVTRWSQAIDACDGFVFVTAEYNHGVPGAFKNAFDVLGNEWAGKPVGFVSYGAENGVRAVEHWRQIVVNFHMVGVRAQVSMSLFTEVANRRIAPSALRGPALATLLDQLVAATARTAT